MSKYNAVRSPSQRVRVYEYAKCSTCRRALNFLKARRIAFTSVPIVEQPPTMAELRAMLGFTGDLKRLFNTSGVLYRELGVASRLKTISESEALSLLSKNGKLVKRPFALLEGRGLLGFDESDWTAAFR